MSTVSQPPRISRFHVLRIRWSVPVLLLLFAGLAAGVPRPESRAAGEASGARNPELLFVAWPGAGLEAWERSKGPRGGRLYDLCLRRGVILRPQDLNPEESAWLDDWSRAAATPLWVAGGDWGGKWQVLGFSPARWSLRIAGTPADGTVHTLADLAESWARAGDTIRWEEVVEILDLTSRENLAFRNLHDPGHFLGALRRAFLQDKHEANSVIFLAGAAHPPELALTLRLAGVYERMTRPYLTAALRALPAPAGLPIVDGSPSLAAAPDEVREDARRRFFIWRVLASSRRIYGRCDRILLSLLEEGGNRSVLVIDARDSTDPFVAVCPGGGAPVGLAALTSRRPPEGFGSAATASAADDAGGRRP